MDDEFSRTVDELQGIVNLLERTPPLDQGDGIRRAFDRLATAIETIPGPPQPARAEAAKLIRSRDFDIWVSLLRENATAAAVRETLEIATGALDLAADGPYSVQSVRQSVDRLKEAVARLSAGKPLREQRPLILSALRDALEALMAIRKVAPEIEQHRAPAD